MWRGKDPDAGKDWRQQEKGATEDERVGWHHRLDGHACILSHFSHVQLFATPWTAGHWASLSFTISESCPLSRWCHPTKLFVLCRPLFLLPSVFPSIRVFSSESVLRIRWTEYWSFSFSISPSSENSRLISFRIDWFELPAIEGTLKNLLQYHSSKASILPCSDLFMVPLSHLYWKNHSFD